METQFVSVNPDSPEYEETQRLLEVNALRMNRRPDKASPFYNQLAEEYNALAVGGTLFIPMPNVIASNLVASFLARGVRRDKDYQMIRVRYDNLGRRLSPEQQTFSLTRLTETEMRLL